MVKRSNILKLALALLVLFLAAAGASSLVATEMDTTDVVVTPLLEGFEAPAELTTEEVTFPVTPWFAAEGNILPGDPSIGCIPGGSCWADWQCGGGNRGYCSAGSCVCL